MKQIILLGIALLSINSLNADIELVRLRFTPGLCDRNCVDLLHKELSDIRQAEAVYVPPGGASAEIQWRQGARFSWEALNTATRMVGLRMRGTWLQVRGKIRERGDQLLLISEGDNTPFQLLGPIQTSDVNYVIRKSSVTHPLPKGVHEALSQGAKEGKEVVIKGPLLMPWRAERPLNLIVESIAWEKKEEEQQRPSPQRKY